jgi:hypothetical protein
LCKFGSDLCFSLSYPRPLPWALLSLSFSLHLDLTIDPILPRGSLQPSTDPSGSDPHSLRDGHRTRPGWDPACRVVRIPYSQDFWRLQYHIPPARCGCRATATHRAAVRRPRPRTLQIPPSRPRHVKLRRRSQRWHFAAHCRDRWARSVPGSPASLSSL